MFLLNEANRCLNCKNPLCRINCPISTEIPEIITLFKEDKIIEAGKRLFENNPLSVFCSIVCPHEEQCRGNCIRGIKGKPVDFPKIERFLSENYLNYLSIEKESEKEIEIAVIGGGVAGITSAILLAKKGFEVTIFESFSKLGGVLRYGIPDFRLPRKYIDRMENYLNKLGVKVKYNVTVGSEYGIKELKRDGFKYIILTTGLWKPKKIGVVGESGKNVHYAINYLISPQNYDLGKNVLVIGGGNVAMDAARTAKRFSKNVTIVYRRGEKDMPANREEIEESRKEGVKFIYHHSPKEIKDKEMIFIENNEMKSIPYSSVLIAVSQEPRRELFISEPELEIEEWGTIKVNEKYETSLENVYSCGDIVTGAKTVVLAVKNAKELVKEIMKKEECKD